MAKIIFSKMNDVHSFFFIKNIPNNLVWTTMEQVLIIVAAFYHRENKFLEGGGPKLYSRLPPIS